MVFLSSAISPRTSTVIFFERSPVATAVVTLAMLRTCEVRFEAITLTESVKSFQVPETPPTSACPPRMPSEPTSRATRVTSEAKALSWSTMVLTVRLRSRISPLTSTVIFLDRSPLATAVVTSAMLRTCAVRFEAIVLTESVRSFHVPAAPSTAACPPSFPSEPTSRATRVTSDAKALSWSTMTLIVSLSSAISPLTSTVIFLDRSPRATAVVTLAILRTCAVRLPAIVLTESVRSFHVPATPVTCACPPRMPSEPTSRATRVTSDANALSWSTIVLIVPDSSRISPARVDGDLFRKIPVRDGGRDVGDVANLRGQISRHRVHRVGKIFPRSGDALDVRLAAEFALGTDFARDARNLGGECIEAIDHLVDRAARSQELAAQRVAIGFERHLLRKVAVRNGAEHAAGLRHRKNQVVDQLVDRLDAMAPVAAHAFGPRAFGDRTFASDDLADTRELIVDILILLDARVERGRDFTVDPDEVVGQPRPKISVSKGANGSKKCRLV